MTLAPRPARRSRLVAIAISLASVACTDPSGRHARREADAGLDASLGGDGQVTAPLDASLDAVVAPGDSSFDSRTDDAGADAALDAALDASQLVSKYCGDSIRDPALEECDDGDADAGGACSVDCRVQSVRTEPAGADGLPLTFGTSPHVIQGHRTGFALTYLEAGTAPRVLMQRFDTSGHEVAAPQDVSAGYDATLEADPVVAAISGGRYVVAWSDASGASPDIVLSEIAATGAAAQPFIAHISATGPQDQPDMLWTGSELVVVWRDLDDLELRRFDADLMPLGPEQALASTAAVESAPFLAAVVDQWAAAWRVADNGFETLRVELDPSVWQSTDDDLPGPAGERPALVQLDDDRLLVLWSVGTQPTVGDYVPRLRFALLSLADPGAMTALQWGELGATSAPVDATTSQAHPAAARVGDAVFLAWHEVDALGNARTLVQEVDPRFDADSPAFVLNLFELPTTAADATTDLRPVFGTSQLRPGDGALLIAWEHEPAPEVGYEGPELWTYLRPIPWVDLGP